MSKEKVQRVPRRMLILLITNVHFLRFWLLFKSVSRFLAMYFELSVTEVF